MISRGIDLFVFAIMMLGLLFSGGNFLALLFCLVVVCAIAWSWHNDPR